MKKIKRYSSASCLHFSPLSIGRTGMILLTGIVLSAFHSFIPQTPQNSTIEKNINLLIHFKAFAGASPLLLGKTCFNHLNEPYTVEKFRFYLGMVRFSGPGSSTAIDKNEYFLVDFADPSSTTLAFSLTEGRYDRIAFLLGVDSIHNTSGAQTGALDPARGMFWTWNSGYVMAKLEGSSPLSNQPAHAIAYHIGGYKGTDNTIRNIELALPAPLEIVRGKTAELTIHADVNAWFSGPHPVSIKSTPACTTPGALAGSIADNYANMFTVAKPNP